MHERQASGMESDPVEAELGAVATVVGAVSVVDVASNGMIDAPKVASDLMASPRLRTRPSSRLAIGLSITPRAGGLPRTSARYVLCTVRVPNES